MPHQVTFLKEMNSVAGDALEKPGKREEVCPMKQRQNFTGIKGKITNICQNVSRVFDASCQKLNKKSKSKFKRLRVEKKLRILRRIVSVSC